MYIPTTSLHPGENKMSTELNNLKREEMKNLIVALEARGYTRQTLGFLMGVSGSSISSWASGKSMGTNAQRLQMAGLPAFDAKHVRTTLEARVARSQERLSLDIQKLEAKKAELLAKSVNGIVREEISNNYSWCLSFEVRFTNVETGEMVTNHVVTYTQPQYDTQVGDVKTYTNQDNAYSGFKCSITREEKFLAAAKKELATFNKKNP